MAARDPETEIWRICEREWAAWLARDGWKVDLVRPFRQDDPGGAPLITIAPNQEVRRPDIEATKGGDREYWEVKYRSRADVNPRDGHREFWMPWDAYDDYYRLAITKDVRVWVILHAAGDHLQPPRWLRISVRELAVCGVTDVRVTASGGRINAWVWPESRMRVVVGPTVAAPVEEMPPLPAEDGDEPVPSTELVVAEQALRQRPDEPAAGSARARVVVEDPMAALDVLRTRLGVPSLPRYSVLRVDERGIDLEGLLGLLEYGIRVFLVASRPPTDDEKQRYLPFIASRLLEWSHARLGGTSGFWAVDGVGSGQRFGDWGPTTMAALHEADDNGGINIGQYRVVHERSDDHVVITAGAGTGKTETMSERIVFLLATSALEDRRGSDLYPYDLRLNDIVLVTFTNEAAAQMRERLSRVLNLRRRLCRRCVLAAVPWMFQLSGTQISTIHKYARAIAQESAAAIGFTPSLAIGSQTLDLRAELNRALSQHIVRLLEEFPDINGDGSVPAAFQWLEHLEQIWEKLADNGIQIMPIGIKAEDLPRIDWGTDGQVDRRAALFAETVRDALLAAAAGFARVCIESGLLPVDQLVPTALQGLLASKNPRVGRPRFLFVDEFQDTDGKQMDLILQISDMLDARLFVVGDVKQGIYRFRGAEGSAFKELERRMDTGGMQPPTKLGLVRNFRTGGVLLDSMDEIFRQWGATTAVAASTRMLLDYATGGSGVPSDVLKPQVERRAQGTRLVTREVNRQKFPCDVVTQVRSWYEEVTHEAEAQGKPPSECKTIGILCRQNWMADRIRVALRSEGLPCEVLVGGTFFQSPAVREARVLFDAIARPDDTAALLELCDTRWFGGIQKPQEPPAGLEKDGDVDGAESVWGSNPGPTQAWTDRLASLADGRNPRLGIDDIAWLRARLSSLRKLLSVMSPVALLAHCFHKFEPQTWAKPDDPSDDQGRRERERYRLCLEHLLVLLDNEVAARPMTLPVLLDFLRLQIATNTKEDEPQLSNLGVVTALTVHKAKGQEFDFVLVPYTWATFESSNATTIAAVVRGSGPAATPKLLWTWRPGIEVANHDGTSQASQLESEESRREETRLLYVAMTRARDRLLIHVARQRKDSTWGELLQLAGV
jgi:superfamily I DNA/RNA helicase